VSPFVAASFHLLAVFFEQLLLIFIEQWQDLLVHALEGTLHPTFCFLMDARDVGFSGLQNGLDFGNLLRAQVKISGPTLKDSRRHRARLTRRPRSWLGRKGSSTEDARDRAGDKRGA
jgi:hypothetical protein